MNTYVTSHTLLTRTMDHEDSEAWEVFVERYHRYIYKLLDKLGVKEEKDDVSQEVMLTIWKKLDTYDRERSKFRTWLSSIIRITVLKSWQQKHKKQNIDGGDSLHGIPDEKSFMDFAEEEWKHFIMQRAMDNISKDFKGKAMEVFQLSLSGLTVDLIGDKLELSKSSVYTLKKRVKKRLLEEVYFLQKDMG
ncbi:RNA polymerase sigma factor [Lentisphaera araneosa]|nr:RNA polymerase sigma factor [Lentisphaera araneosa]